MHYLFLFLVFVKSLFTATPIKGLSSIFAQPNDKLAGGPSRCLQRRVLPTDLGVAHRTLKCGSRLFLWSPRTRLFTVAQVLDKGPWGGMDNGQWVLKTSESDPGVWRGDLDLTPAVASQLQHNGMEKIVYAVIK